MRPQILFLRVQPQQIFLILTVSMAIVFIYSMNTAITFVYEYFSLSTDVLIMTVFNLFVSAGIELCFIYDRGIRKFPL
jgi:hypothetical protein